MAIALATTGKTTVVHCPTHDPGLEYALGYVEKESGRPWQMYLPRQTCQNLVNRPTWENLWTYTHELVHIRYPKFHHGRLFDRITARWLPGVRKRLNELAIR